MTVPILHVEPRGNQWTVQRDGDEQSSSIHSTKSAALIAARGQARAGDEIRIHEPDETIREQVAKILPAVPGQSPGNPRSY